mgnify:CR=1 FL=1
MVRLRAEIGRMRQALSSTNTVRQGHTERVGWRAAWGLVLWTDSVTEEAFLLCVIK